MHSQNKLTTFLRCQAFGITDIMALRVTEKHEHDFPCINSMALRKHNKLKMNIKLTMDYTGKYKHCN